MWRVEYTDEFGAWFDRLSRDDEEAVASIRAAMRVLRDTGPTLGRPFAERVKDSTYHNMKELRPLGTSIRILFAFDPRRVAILLLAGDKKGRWNAWYAEQIPIADGLYAAHLRAISADIDAQQTTKHTTKHPRKDRTRR